MKSLDITNCNLDLSRDRQVTIKFVGGSHRSRLHSGTYTVTIPYSSLSQRMRQIHQFGGKILDVTISRTVSCVEANSLSMPDIISAESFIPEINEAVVEEIVLVEAVPAKQENQQEENHVDVLENVAIAIEIIEESPDVANETITEVGKTVAIVESAPVSEPKPKRSRASSKAGSGFSKPKAEAKTARSSKKSKS